MLPSKFPLQTSRYDHYWKHFQSAEFIKHICSVDWDISTYEGKGDPKNIAELDLLPEFKITDPRLTWFSKITDDYHFKQLINLSKELLENNDLKLDPLNLGFALIVLVPGAHLQEHIDKGDYAGTTLIVPVIGKGIFTYEKGSRKFLINSPTFASNTVWHNYKNNTNCLHIFFTLALPIEIENLKETDLIPANEL
jgi:hypothetical protein